MRELMEHLVCVSLKDNLPTAGDLNTVVRIPLKNAIVLNEDGDYLDNASKQDLINNEYGVITSRIYFGEHSDNYIKFVATLDTVVDGMAVYNIEITGMSPSLEMQNEYLHGVI